jgi:hypothetical protein
MERIAYLAWGSLVWNPGALPLQSDWFDDGPDVSVEFARISRNGRLTLVLCAAAAPVTSLWACTSLTSLDQAAEALALREGISPTASATRIGRWQTGQEDPAEIVGIVEWAKRNGITAAIWTNLRPNFADGLMPSVEQVMHYLRGLDGEKRTLAEEYVRKTPRQITTGYRRRIEAEFGWTPVAAL